MTSRQPLQPLNKAAHINQDNNHVQCLAAPWMRSSCVSFSPTVALAPRRRLSRARCLFSCTLSLLPCATQYGSGGASLRLPSQKGIHVKLGNQARGKLRPRMQALQGPTVAGPVLISHISWRFIILREYITPTCFPFPYLALQIAIQAMQASSVKLYQH